MRQVAGLVCVGMLVCFTGCASTRWNFLKKEEPTPGPGGKELPSVAALVQYMNENSGRLQNVKVEELWVDASSGFQSFSMRGQMVTQKPRNFRMSAKVAGQQVVDMGSNDHEFWYWVSKGPPHQMYCSYKDLQDGRASKMPFPFQPDWVMEAMGLGNYGPAERYQLESDADSIRLVEKSVSPQGKPVKKVIVMKRRPVLPPSPQVTEFLLLEESGKEICSAHIKETQVDRSTGAILPRRMEIRYPAEKMKLGMKLDGTTVNVQTFATMFQRERMQGVASFNMATMVIDNSPPPQIYTSLDSKIQPVQGP